MNNLEELNLKTDQLKCVKELDSNDIFEFLF